jgi:heptosyltransferase-3
LVIATRRLGDVLLTTPLLRSLHEAWPGARIDVLVFSNTGAILAGNPDISEIIEIDERPDKQQHLQLARRVFRRYDLAVTTQGSDRPFLYALLAAPTRVGIVPDESWKNAWKRWISTGWVLLDNINTHTVLQNLRLADILGIRRHYTMVPPANSGKDTLTRIAPALSHKQAYAVIHPYPKYQYKHWTVRGWQKLISAMLDDDLVVVITGGPDEDERRYCADLAGEFSSRVINTAGLLDFSELTTLITSGTCFIGPDTSVTHLAAACGTPVIALYGPSNPVKWGPWPADAGAHDNSPFIMHRKPWQRSGNITLIQGVADCVPCFMEGCERHRNSHSRCLDDLPAATVITAMKEALASEQ